MRWTRAGNERRHFKRYKVDDIEGRLRSARDLVVRDISLTGLAVETDLPLRIGETYTLAMGGRADAIEVAAEVKWCNLVEIRPVGGKTSNVYHAGLDFSEALDDQAHELLSFIQGHIVVDLDQHLSGHLRRHDAAIEVGGPQGFLVRSVSFSGMLIETEVPRLPPKDSILEIELTDERLPLECAARVADVETWEKKHGECQQGLRLEFQDLSIDDSLALDYFIRNVLE